jgi:hypothetical protein
MYRIIFLVAALALAPACSSRETRHQPPQENTEPNPTGPPPFDPCDNQLTVEWDASPPVAPVDGYNVYVGRDSRKYLGRHQTGDTTYTIPGLGEGTYFFTVSAYNGGGESSQANEVTHTFSGCGQRFDLRIQE